MTVEAVRITIITRSDYSDGSLPAVLLLYHVRLPMAGGEILGVVFGWGTKCNRMVMVPRRWNRLVPFVCLFGLRDGFGRAHLLCRNGEITSYACVHYMNNHYSVF